MIPKPEPQKKVKARTFRQHMAARKACRDAVWKRADGCCQACGKWVKRSREAESLLEIGHVHEIIPRSLGGSDTDPENCELLCFSCHFDGPSGAHRKTNRETPNAG